MTTSDAAANFVAVPAASSPLKPPVYTDIHQQLWQLTLTGVVILENDQDPPVQGFPGTAVDDWTRTTLTVGNAAPAVSYLIKAYDMPAPAFGYTEVGIQVSQIASFFAVSSSFLDGTTDAGFAVDAWNTAPYESARSFFQGPVARPATAFAGVNVDIAVRNNKATIYRLSYQITITGTVVYVGDGN
jgi:hypothetical protein